MLPQGVNRVVDLNERIQGIDSLFRSACRVRRPTVKFNVDRRTRERLPRQFVAPLTRVHAERCVDVLEKAFAHETSLGASVFPTFFAGRAVDADFTSDLIDDGL